MDLRPGYDAAFMNSLGEGHLPGYLGVVIVELRPGVLLAELPLREHLFAPNGYLHAGSVVSLADTAAGYACLAHLSEGASFTTLELKANFVRALREGVLHCEARAVHLGRTTHVWDAIVTGDGDERPVALFRCTQLVLYPS
jgi:1,4-dihydroxy-2-naphthoyl-CoA hydrolase